MPLYRSSKPEWSLDNFRISTLGGYSSHTFIHDFDLWLSVGKNQNQGSFNKLRTSKVGFFPKNRPGLAFLVQGKGFELEVEITSPILIFTLISFQL